MPIKSRSLSRRVPLIVALAALALALCAPQALAARYVYTGNYNDSTMSVIDTATNQIVGSPIPTGSGLDSIAIAPNGKTVYATSGDGVITVVDALSNQVVTSITGTTGLETIAISPDGKTAYVSSPPEDLVVVVDLQTNQVVGSIPVGDNPIGVAFSPDGKVVYVANDNDDNVSVIDTATRQVVGAPIPVGDEPVNVVVSPDGKTLYVDNEGVANVSVVDTATKQVVGTVPVGNEPWGLGLSPNGARLYVSNNQDDTVSVIDTATKQVVGDPITVGDEPYELAVTPDGKFVYVANYGDEDSVTVINTQTNQTSNIPVPGGPWQVAIVPDQSPIASFTAKASKKNPLQIGFTSTTIDSDGAVAVYDWNFGDGKTALNGSPTPKHTYAKAGKYTVGLTATDNEGCSVNMVFTGRTAFCSGAAAAALPITVKAPNNFKFGKLIRNSKTGTAKLKVKVPYAGKLTLSGRAVKKTKRGAKKKGVVTLSIKPKPKTLKALGKAGSAKVRVKVTFKPKGNKAKTKGRSLKLIKR
jgi:YVTN family beta-propeller protein